MYVLIVVAVRGVCLRLPPTLTTHTYSLWPHVRQVRKVATLLLRLLWPAGGAPANTQRGDSRRGRIRICISYIRGFVVFTSTDKDKKHRQHSPAYTGASANNTLLQVTAFTRGRCTWGGATLACTTDLRSAKTDCPERADSAGTHGTVPSPRARSMRRKQVDWTSNY